MIERVKAKVLQDIEIAENEGFIPTGLATLYLLTAILDQLESLQKGQQGVAQNATTPPAQPGKSKQEADYYNRWQEFHEATGLEFIDEMRIRPEQREAYLQQRLYLYDAWCYDKESNENHEEQAPNPQSHATDDVREGQDQGQSDGALHQAQEAIRGDGSNDDGSSGSSTTGEAITTRITSEQEAETRGSVDHQSVGEDYDGRDEPQAQEDSKEVFSNAQEAADAGPNPRTPIIRDDSTVLPVVSTTEDVGRAALPLPTNNITEATSAIDQTPHWQDTDEDTQKALVALKAKGVAYLTWEADNSPDICDACVANHGKRVRLGERFPSGAYCTPEHGNCGCGCKEEMETGGSEI